MLKLKRNLQPGDEIRIGPVRARLARIGRWRVQVDVESPSGRIVRTFRGEGQVEAGGAVLRLNRIGPACVLFSIAAPTGDRIETSWPRGRATTAGAPT